MTSLMDVLGTDAGMINSYILDGWLRKSAHRYEPLAILNYTEKATFAKHWDQVTLNCRGLIYNTETLEVVARPFPKFFNHNEENAAKFDLSDKVVVTDKKDGSMGILYRRPSDGEYAIATRGSFHSRQAERATEMLGEQYEQTRWYQQLRLISDLPWTFIFEIIYPENRIVLDYDGLTDLVMLGAVGNKTGTALSANQARVMMAWPGPQTECLGIMTYAEALNLPPRANAEGIVLLGYDNSRMVKLKQEDYIILHRLITGLNTRTVWQAIVANQTLPQLLEPLPEEFHPWVTEVFTSFVRSVNLKYQKMYDRYVIIRDELDMPHAGPATTEDKKRFALAIKDDPDKWAYFLFAVSGDVQIFKQLWKLARPEAGQGLSHTPHEENDETG